MQPKRVAILIYSILVISALVFRSINAAPTLLFWVLLLLVGASIVFLIHRTFFHPTPLEITAYHINLIMRHTSENHNEEYDIKNKAYLSRRFINSSNFDFFYYGDCCMKIDQYSQMKIRLAIQRKNFNHVAMVIETMDHRYIKFRVIKNTYNPYAAFLYDWEIDGIEYSNQLEFIKLTDGH